MADSFTFTLALTVTSEKLKKTFHLPHELVQGVPYIQLLRKNTVLGRLTGQVSGTKYFQNVNVFNYLQERRNDMVSELLMKAQTEADIGADVDAKSAPLGAERIRLFHKHQIEPVLTLKLPAFKTKLHQCEDFSMKVLATPSMRASVSMEASDANMKWFIAACTHTWPISTNTSGCKRDYLHDALPEQVKIRKISDKKICLYINYKKSANKWGKYAVSIQKDKFPDEEALHGEIQANITRMQEFYASNHVGEKDEVASEGGAESERGSDADDDSEH